MANFVEGDRVKIVTREQTEEDIKTNSYFPYFGGLTGKIEKYYSEKEIAVDIEPESLTRDIRKRHEDVRDQMKSKWLEGLSEEGRNRLTEREKDFHLRYVILTATGDLEKIAPREIVEQKAEPATAHRKTLEEIEADEAAELARRQTAG